MATGKVVYWNGDSGWIKQDGVENRSTAEGHDVMLLSRFLPKEGANIVLGSSLEFDIAADGTARNISLVGERPDRPEQPPEPAPPVIDYLNPASMVVGSNDTPLHVLGSGFTAESVIVFNGGDEPTTFYSAAQVMTIVKPSTASGAVTVPIQVRNSDGQISNSVDFSLIEE